MRKEIVKVYEYKYKCSSCDEEKSIYYTLPDFGDSPIIKKCKYCNELYWYTYEDEAYIASLEKHLANKTCIKCNNKLQNALIPLYKDIQCGNEKISLDDDFIDTIKSDKTKMKDIEVVLLYS